MSVLIDSDILIEVSRARDPAILARWGQLSSTNASLVCSPVTVAELWQGARPSEHALLSTLFAALHCIPIDIEIGIKAGEYLGLFGKSHHVELGDAFIAATVSVHNLELWTRNRKPYPMKDIAFY